MLWLSPAIFCSVCQNAQNTRQNRFLCLSREITFTTALSAAGTNGTKGSHSPSHHGQRGRVTSAAEAVLIYTCRAFGPTPSSALGLGTGLMGQPCNPACATCKRQQNRLKGNLPQEFATDCLTNLCSCPGISPWRVCLSSSTSRAREGKSQNLGGRNVVAEGLRCASEPLSPLGTRQVSVAVKSLFSS